MTLDYLNRYRPRTSRRLGSFSLTEQPFLVRKTLQPPDVAGLLSWVRAEDLALADGASVATWSDISGNGNDWTAPSTNPTFETGELNGFSVVRFPVSSSGLNSGITFNSGDFTIIYVGQYAGASAQRRAIQGTNNWLMGPYQGRWASFTGAFAPAANGVPATANNGPVVHALTQITSTSSTTWVGSSKDIAATANAPGTLRMSLTASSGSGEAFGGDLAECMVYNVALTEIEVLSIKYGLEKKYGLR